MRRCSLCCKSKKKLVKRLKYTSIYFSDENYCSHCQIRLPRRVLIIIHSMMHLFQNYNFPQFDIMHYTYLENNRALITCLYCQEILMSDQQFIRHMETIKHANAVQYFKWSTIGDETHTSEDYSSILRLPENRKIDKKNEFTVIRKTTCKACHLTFYKSEIEQHSSNTQHLSSIQKFDGDLKKTQIRTIGKKNIENDATYDPKDYKCFICNKQFRSVTELFEHYDHSTHQQKMEHFHQMMKKKLEQESKCIFTEKKAGPLFDTNKVSSEIKEWMKEVEAFLKTESSQNNSSEMEMLNQPEEVCRKSPLPDFSSEETPKIIQLLSEMDIFRNVESGLNDFRKIKMPKQSEEVCRESPSPDFSSEKTPKTIQFLSEMDISLKVESGLNDFDEIGMSNHSEKVCSKSPSPDLSSEESPRIIQLLSELDIYLKAESGLNDISGIEMSNQSGKVSNVAPSYNRLDRYRTIESDTNAIEIMSKYNLDTNESDVFKELQYDLDELITVDFTKKQLRMMNRREKFRPQFDPDGSLFNYADHYIKLCIDTVSTNIFLINEQTVTAQTLGYESIIAYQSKLFCLLCKCEIAANEFNYCAHFRELNHIHNFNRSYYLKLVDTSESELAQELMLREQDDRVHCYACDVKIQNSNSHISDHVQLTEHVECVSAMKEKSKENHQKLVSIYNNVWYYAQVYSCYICNDKFDNELEFVVHLESTKHLLSLEKFIRGNKFLRFDVCLPCATYWYGTCSDYNEHCKTQMHESLTRNLQFLCPNLLLVAENFLKKMEENAEKLIEESNSVTGFLEQEREQNLLQSLEKIVKSTYPTAKAHVFGSRFSRTGFPNSDVDVFLDCENIYHDTETKKTSKRCLKIVESLIEDHEDNWIIDEVELRCRVPILKLRHIDTSLNCNISFVNGLRVEKSKLIRYYNAASPICRSMILYLKKWLICCHLVGSDGIDNHALSWFVIFFLQIKGFLPSVHQLLQTEKQTAVINGWECRIAEEIPQDMTVLPVSSLRMLLMNFFSFYNTYSYQTSVMSPFLGRSIPKKSFANMSMLPREFRIYKIRVRQMDIEHYRLDTPMSVQDPVDHSQNITKTVSKFQLRCFMEYCCYGLHILKDDDGDNNVNITTSHEQVFCS